jgi:hypothetical protein
MVRSIAIGLVSFVLTTGMILVAGFQGSGVIA